MNPLRTLIAATTRLPGESDDALNQRVADAYPEYARTPRTTFVTYTTLGDAWEEGRPQQLTVWLESRKGSANPDLAADVLYADKVLSGAGFDPQHPRSLAMMAAFVGAGACSQDESDRVRYVYPEAPGKEQVAAERQDMEFVAWADTLDQYRRLGPLPASAIAGQTLTAEQMAQVAEAMLATINAWRGKTDLTGRPTSLAAFEEAVNKVVNGEGA
jgi:hypothetical protein